MCEKALDRDEEDFLASDMRSCATLGKFISGGRVLLSVYKSVLKLNFLVERMNRPKIK